MGNDLKNRLTGAFEIGGCENRVVLRCQGLIWAVAMKLSCKLSMAEEID